MTTVALFRPDRGNIAHSRDKQTTFEDINDLINIITRDQSALKDVTKRDIEVKYKQHSQTLGWEKYIIYHKLGELVR